MHFHKNHDKRTQCCKKSTFKIRHKTTMTMKGNNEIQNDSNCKSERRKNSRAEKNQQSENLFNVLRIFNFICTSHYISFTSENFFLSSVWISLFIHPVISASFRMNLNGKYFKINDFSFCSFKIRQTQKTVNPMQWKIGEVDKHTEGKKKKIRRWKEIPFYLHKRLASFSYSFKHIVQWQTVQ